METNILDVFHAHQGIIALAGAGGKKSTMYRLASAHSGRIAVTSTVHTPRFRQRMNVVEVVSDEKDLLERVMAAADSSFRIAYAQPGVKAARLRGVSPEIVRTIHEQLGCDATFVKADGARLRWLKAPNHNKPALPFGTTVLISLLSVRAVGKPLTAELAHHARDVANVMKIEIGEKITAVHLARLISSHHVVLDNAGDIKLIPVLNMVESKEDLKLARLVRDPSHLDSIVDVAGYSACLREVTREV